MEHSRPNLNRESANNTRRRNDGAARRETYPGRCSKSQERLADLSNLVAEAVPGARSRIDWHFELEKRTAADEVDTEALIQRADELREQTRGR